MAVRLGTSPQDCWRLPNGNILLSLVSGGVELTPDKKAVRQFGDHAHFKTINQIQFLDIPGDVSNGEILR